MKQSKYLFIVGSFRTGTTLLVRTLNSSEDIAICGETHFLALHLVGFPRHEGFREKFAKVGDISTTTGIRKIVDYIYGDQLKAIFDNDPSYWRWVWENIKREKFLDALLNSDRTERALFKLCLELYGDNKPILGEKTPGHIHHVPTLLTWFPDAKIIHTFRDPRAIFVSVRKRAYRPDYGGSYRYRLFRRLGLPFDIFLALHVFNNWLQIAKLHYKYQQQLPAETYFLSRYEDLVMNPGEQLQLQFCNRFT